MPTNAETVSRRPKIVIVGHNQCQAEPVSSPCRFPRHQSDRFSVVLQVEAVVPLVESGAIHTQRWLLWTGL